MMLEGERLDKRLMFFPSFPVVSFSPLLNAALDLLVDRTFGIRSSRALIQHFSYRQQSPNTVQSGNILSTNTGDIDLAAY